MLALRLAILAACLASAAPTAAASASVSVRVRVLPYVRIMEMDSPRDIWIAPADLARGYVEVPAARLILRANTRLAVTFEAQARWLRSAAVSGLGDRVFVRQGAPARAMPGSGGTFLVAYRLELEPGTAPGRYDWPLTLTFHPL